MIADIYAKYYYMSYYFNDGYEFDYIGDNYIKFVDLQFIFYKIFIEYDYTI